MSEKKNGKDDLEAEPQSAPRRLWEWWKRVARKIGDFNARVILTIFYCVLLMPFALMVKLFTDPLRIKSKTEKRWLHREAEKEGDLLEKAARQS